MVLTATSDGLLCDRASGRRFRLIESDTEDGFEVRHLVDDASGDHFWAARPLPVQD